MCLFSTVWGSAAATILNIIVISASISAINSDIFGAGRMMYGMSKEGLAPKASSASPATVCRMTVVVMGGALLAAVVLNYLIPSRYLC